MAEIIKIASLEIQTDKLIKSMQETKEELADITEENKRLKESGQETSEAFIRNEAAAKTLRAEYNKQIKTLQTVSDGNNQLDESLKAEIKTVDGAIANNKQLRLIRNQINTSTDEGAKAVEAINKKIDENTDYVKENGSALEKQKMNIGNYKDDIKEAANEINPLNGGLSGFIQRSKEAGGVLPLLSKGIKGVARGIWGMTTASLAFLATPIGAVIGAIALVLAPLIVYFKSTQEGIDKVTRALRPMKILFEMLIGTLQEFGKVMVDAWDDPKTAMKDFNSYLKEEVAKTIIGVSKAWEKFKSGDIKGAIEEVYNVSGFKKMADVIGEANEVAARQLDLEEKLRKGEIEFVKNQAQLTNELADQNKILEDKSKSLAEREEAGRKAAELQNQLHKEKVARMEDELALMVEINSVNDTSDEAKLEMARKEAEIMDEKANFANQETALLKKVNVVRKEVATDAANYTKKIMDEALKKQNEELDLFIASQGFKKKSQQEELNFERELAEKKLDYLKAQLEAGKISEIKYATDVANIKNGLLEKQSQITLDNAQAELEDYIELNRSKLDSDQYMSEERLRIEQERLESEATKRREFEELRFREGEINQKQYNSNINQINKENREQLEAAELERKEALALTEAMDFENKLELEAERNALNLEYQTDKLNAQKELELSKAEETGANLSLIHQKYAQRQKDLEADVLNAKLSIQSQALGGLIGIMGAESNAGKALAVSQTTMDTYRGATAAYASGAKISPIYGTLAAAAAVTSGLINVKKILSTKEPKVPNEPKTPKFNLGGILKGRSHANGGIKTPYGELEGDEIVLTKGVTSNPFLRSLASDLNVAGGGRQFAKGGMLGSVPAPSGFIDYDLLSSKIAEANSYLPSPRVAVDEINTVTNRVQVTENLARF